MVGELFKQEKPSNYLLKDIMKKQPLFTNHQKGLLYTIYIAVASISLFVFANSGYVLFESIIWKYTTTYVINAAIITLISLFTAKLLFYTAYTMAQGKQSYTIGLIGCFLPVIYPILLFIVGQQPSSGEYLLLLTIPAVVLGIITILSWKRIQ